MVASFVFHLGSRSDWVTRANSCFRLPNICTASLSIPFFHLSFHINYFPRNSPPSVLLASLPAFERPGVRLLLSAIRLVGTVGLERRAEPYFLDLRFALS